MRKKINNFTKKYPALLIIVENHNKKKITHRFRTQRCFLLYCRTRKPPWRGHSRKTLIWKGSLLNCRIAWFKWSTRVQQRRTKDGWQPRWPLDLQDNNWKNRQKKFDEFAAPTKKFHDSNLPHAICTFPLKCKLKTKIKIYKHICKQGIFIYQF